MPRQMDEDLRRIRERLLAMGGRVEEMIAAAMHALAERDPRGAEAVIEADIRVDRLEKEIDGLCHVLLVRHHPMAIDHRLLIAVMKMTNDLERMADSAKNIARGVIRLGSEPPIAPRIDLPRMSSRVQAMVRDGLDAFVHEDLTAAYRVLRSDDEVDALYRRMFDELLRFMGERPETVSRAVQFLLIGRNLERIADHATNVAENVIYHLEGRDVRHPATAGLGTGPPNPLPDRYPGATGPFTDAT